MKEYSIETLEYGFDVADKVRRALRGAEGVGVKGGGSRARVITRDEEARERLCMALCRVLLWDAAKEEIKAELEAYGLAVQQLENAAQRGAELMRTRKRCQALFAYAAAKLMDYTRSTYKINLEGFLRFRLGQARGLIKLCALCAAAEEALRSELGADEGAMIIVISPCDNADGEPD